MPFVCPPKEDSSKRLEVLKQIKDLVNKLGEPAVPVKLQVPCVPCCVPCAPPPCPPPVKSSEKKCKPPDVMVCYRIHKGKAQGQGTEDEGGGKGGDAGNMNIDDYCCYPATIETQLCPFEPCPCEGGS
ncbi:uncharacterized protein LOC108732700 isoform X2 [Agrilus planipennis]|uniref:Uncharacterized protein LOC108732700 isoform X2 n=1 Tax=Agrilus planipennis TaxID=224129 RepID=A0A1W4W4S6_AGRPL|nr:uncharacterized protein LOC108732700 isoform X2 [Agrilus planipennis]